MFSFNSLRSLAQDMRRKLGVYSALESYQVNQSQGKVSTSAGLRGKALPARKPRAKRKHGW